MQLGYRGDSQRGCARQTILATCTPSSQHFSSFAAFVCRMPYELFRSHVVEECNSGIEEIRNGAAQDKQFSPLARPHRNNFPHSLIWYAECLKKSVKREATKRWQSKKPSDARQEAVMTVLLVLMMFAIFLTIDFFYSKAKHPVLQVARRSEERRRGKQCIP